MFCKLEQSLSTDGHTVIDNKFLINYITDAPAVALKVYLMGLALVGDNADNSLQAMANKLNMTEDDVLDAYLYWEELGLVNLYKSNPPQVEYLSVRSTASMLKKIKPSKYDKFGKEMQHIINGRMLTVNEYNEYYMFLENTTFAPDALLAVAQYCVDLKGNDINYAYVLTVARNQLAKGALTREAVQNNLNSQCKYDNDLKIILKLLGVKRAIDHQDRELFEKWNKMGFQLEQLSYIAKQISSGGMKRLNSLCQEYYRNGTISVKEIETYRAQKESMTDIAIDINRTIGVYYQSLDGVIEEYVSRWVQLGYDKQSLHTIALYCFKNSIRTLEGMSKIVDKFYKQGLVSQQSLVQYFIELNQKDELIKEVLTTAGIVRNVTQADRMLYDNWTDSWNLPHELIVYVASISTGAINAVQYINKILSTYKQNGIATVEQAKQAQLTTTAVKQSNQSNRDQQLDKHEYTDEQLNQLFSTIENLEI